MVLSPPSNVRALTAVVAAAVLLGTSACGQQLSVENADVPAWQATAMPSASGIVAEHAGKILNAQPVDQTQRVPAGKYTLTLVCEGGGKAFLAVRSGGRQLADLGAACYGTREAMKISLTEETSLELSTSSVDAPLIYAYQLATSE